MTGRKFRKQALMAAFCLVLVATVVMATATAQETGNGKKAVQKVSLLETLKKGGVIGWTIVFLSMAAVALTVEHALSIRRSALLPMSSVLQMRALIKKRDFGELRDFCEEDRSYIAKVIGAAVSEPRGSYEDVEDAMIETGSDQSARLYRKIEYLSLIGNVSPMLGLLGTVVGMIQSFNTIERTGGFAKPAELAGGISKALITTCLGLMVAIPTLVVYVYFRNKIEQLSTEVADVGEELMKPIRMRALREGEGEDANEG
ncbi:MAG: MotA/TolQ/ExbB proton channel family protein [Planctomycetes bacterium]|nr:MotA/TolQ/ExbB proton channel family protein [Planctomycetota bacterium]